MKHVTSLLLSLVAFALCAVSLASAAELEWNNERIAALVQDLIKQLEVIKEQFARVLVGMYHHRIGYPRASGGIGAEFEPVERS